MPLIRNKISLSLHTPLQNLFKLNITESGGIHMSQQLLNIHLADSTIPGTVGTFHQGFHVP